MAKRFPNTSTAQEIPGEEPIRNTLLNANTVVAATTDNTPASLFLPGGTFLGRRFSGGPVAMQPYHALYHLQTTGSQDIAEALDSGGQNNYAPESTTAWYRANTFVWSGVSAITVTGFDHNAGDTETVLDKLIVNNGTASMFFPHDDPGSIAAHRMYCPDGATYELKPGNAVRVRFMSSTIDRWILVDPQPTALTGAQIKALYEVEANAFTDAQFTKLGGIETGATADQTGAEIKTAYEAEANAFTDAQFTKLGGIEALATADQTGAEIKTAYEAEANAFTDAQFTKLGGIETAATADQTGAEIKAAYEGEADTNAFDDAAVASLADALHLTVADELSALAAKTPLTGADVLPGEDSAASGAKVKASIGDILNALVTSGGLVVTSGGVVVTT